MDNNIMAEKNQAAWEPALKAGGNRDYTLRILPKANHLQLEAKAGSNAELQPCGDSCRSTPPPSWSGSPSASEASERP
jgi:hypothetical protein